MNPSPFTSWNSKTCDRNFPVCSCETRGTVYHQCLKKPRSETTVKMNTAAHKHLTHVHAYNQFGEGPFLHDCTPVQTARSIKAWFDAEELKWFAQSLDLNPTEHF